MKPCPNTRRHWLVISVAFALLIPYLVCTAESPVTVVLSLETSTLELHENATVRLTFPDGFVSPGHFPAFELIGKEKKVVPAKSITQITQPGTINPIIQVVFENNIQARFEISCQKSFAMFKLVELTEPAGNQQLETIDQMVLFRLGVPEEAEILPSIGLAVFNGKKVSVTTGSINVRPLVNSSRTSKSNFPGCSHTFTPTETTPTGSNTSGGNNSGRNIAARFDAQNTLETKTGWSFRGGYFGGKRDLTGIAGIRAWVHGDGNRQLLKIQLFDNQNGHRDDYITIDFTGWKQVWLTSPALNDLHYDSVLGVNFYYNGLPAKTAVSCIIDDVEAVWKNADGSETVNMLEDFNDLRSKYFDIPTPSITANSYSKFGLAPAVFAVIACPENEWFNAVERFQKAAQLPNIYLRGEWAKQSTWTRESYFFLTNFTQNQTDEALALIKRGKFRHSLVEQHSWSVGSGHYVINDKRFDNGIEGLKATVKRFNDAGITFGLHILGAGIEPPDAYITPVPDSRMLTGAEIPLSADINASADFIPTAVNPMTAGSMSSGSMSAGSARFLATEGPSPYNTTGTILRIGDELIRYERVSETEPFGFLGCKRGHLGTKPADHSRNDLVKHFVRSYGYHKYDQHSSLAKEVAKNFADLCAELNIQMVYFDGSERLDLGDDHWYYNALLHRTFYDAFQNKNLLFQASSWSPYSWNMLARSASADGHDDLKAYLEERGGSFGGRKNLGMPLDIGWYYCYDKKATLDMYEYVLGATIGYNSSMSFQTSVDAAKAHPFTGEILDLIGRYEDLRLSGRIPESMRDNFIIDPVLLGTKTVEQRNALLEKRKDYRLLGQPGKEYFQRVRYGLWQNVTPEDPASRTWQITVVEPARIGFDIQAQNDNPSAIINPTIINPTITITSETGEVFTLSQPVTLQPGQYGISWPGEPIGHYGAPLPQGEYLDTCGKELKLPAGTYTVVFSCEGNSGVPSLPARIRLTQQPDQILEIPAGR